MVAANAPRPASSARPRAPSGAALRVVQLATRTSLASSVVTQMLDTTRALLGRGHSVTVVTRPSEPLARRCAEIGAAYRPLPLRGVWDLISLRRLRRLLTETRTEVLHARGRTAHLVAMAGRHGDALPVVVVERGTSFPPGHLAALAYRSHRVDRIVATCEDVRRVILARAGVAPARVEVVFAAVDVSHFDPALADRALIRSSLGVEPTDALIGHIGMHDWRGWKELLRAFPPVLKRHPEAHLVLVGSRSDRQRRAVLEAAAEMGLGGRVSATTPVVDPRDLLAACAVVVDPSWAGIGISTSVQQAMALARPVVASAVAGNPELVENGVSGLLVAPHDVASLSAAINRLLEDPALASRLGRAARRTIRARFTLEARGSRLERVYRHALRNPRRDHRR